MFAAIPTERIAGEGKKSVVDPKKLAIKTPNNPSTVNCLNLIWKKMGRKIMNKDTIKIKP